MDNLFLKYKNYKPIFNIVARVLQYAVTQGYIEENQKSVWLYQSQVHVKNSLQKNAPKPFIILQEVKKLIDCLDDHQHLMWRAFFRLLIYTGIRRGEALALGGKM